MQIDRVKLYAALDANASFGNSLRIFVGVANPPDIWKLHEALGKEPLVSGWSITRQEGGFREDGFWTTEPGIVVEFISTGEATQLETTDALIEAVALWARAHGEQELLIVHNQGLWTTTLNLKGLLEDAPALV